MIDMQSSTSTPLMKQYFAIKSDHPKALLFFQVGDFYELFFNDAKQASAFLGITLTSRGKHLNEPIPLCGVPVHTVEFYITKLIRGGFRIVICDQLEPAVAGKVVARGVTKVLTPGTLTDNQMLDEKSSCYLFSFFPTVQSWGLVIAELLTAQLFATTIPAMHYKTLEAELTRFFPDEILLSSDKSALPFNTYFAKLGYCTTVTDYLMENESYECWIEQQFSSINQQMFARYESVYSSCKLLYSFLKKHQEPALSQFNSCTYYQPEEFLMLDASTQTNLELVKNMQNGGRKNSLYELMDKSITSMGSRMIKKWLVRPLINSNTIKDRHDAVACLLNSVELNQALRSLYMRVGDFERIVGRIALKRASLQDYIHLSNILLIVPEFNDILEKHHCQVPVFASIIICLNDFSSLSLLLQRSLISDLSSDTIIRSGFDNSLDQLRDVAESSTHVLVNMERDEQQKTGINSLKISYNNVHGYFIEITKANLHLVPDYYIRHQTLVGKERFTTIELKKLEADIIHAKQEAEQLEKKIFESIKSEVQKYIPELRKAAHALATLDALMGFAQVAYEQGYVRPSFNEDRQIIIKDGKHPVIAAHQNSQFIPNDTLLDQKAYFWIVTGPNMGGKSTYLRQVALIHLLAQCGSFVPARYASLSILDRIFTRIGAGDNVAQGKSTFLVEMEEASLICTSATERSLIILDEVGRGTSTTDGLAIAWSIVEYLYSQVKAFCLFATHYHELTALEKELSGIKNYHTASKQTQQGILLLHKILPGVAQGSFGIEVAKLAALPEAVVIRAQEILAMQMQQQIMVASNEQSHAIYTENQQLKYSIAQLKQSLSTSQTLIDTLNMLDPDTISARQALDFIWSLKELLKKNSV